MRTTEQASAYQHLDEMTTEELLVAMNTEDKTVPMAVERSIPQIEKLVEGIVDRMKRGGRVFYIGAGTSGRMGIIDASEIPPTYGVRGKFIGIIAGGDGAIRTAVEGAEDDWEQGWNDILQYAPTAEDTLVGIAASGTTPYVIGAVKRARALGLLTSCITNNDSSPLAAEAEVPIETIVGPEFVTGSTRMKAATALKLTLNMISTATMIRLGHVRGSRMVDMELTNKKLVDRGARMIMEETGIDDYDQARQLLLQYGKVRQAVEAYRAQQQ